jgi:hypothetical protein
MPTKKRYSPWLHALDGLDFNLFTLNISLWVKGNVGLLSNIAIICRLVYPSDELDTSGVVEIGVCTCPKLAPAGVHGEVVVATGVDGVGGGTCPKLAPAGVHGEVVVEAIGVLVAFILAIKLFRTSISTPTKLDVPVAVILLTTVCSAGNSCTPDSLIAASVAKLD